MISVKQDKDFRTKMSGQKKIRSTTREAQGAATRQRILGSALKHFGSKGFEGASLRDISVDAGITHAVIRQHFGTKYNLWKEAIDSLFELHRRNISEFDQPAEQLTRASFEQLIRSYVRFCADHPDYMRVLLHETMKDSERFDWVVEKHLLPIHNKVRALFEKAKEIGILNVQEIESAMYIFISSSQMIFAMRAEVKKIYKKNVLEQSFVENHADAIIRAIIKKAPE